MKTTRILIFCTGNSCHSQMAEGLLRQAADDLIKVYSAGINPVGYVHPLAIEVMEKIGIDMSTHTSKRYEKFINAEIDIVITVCDEAKEAANHLFEDARHFQWSFENPSKVAHGCETILDAFRLTRGEIAPIFQAFAAGYTQAQNPVAAAPTHSEYTKIHALPAIHALP